MMLGGDYSQDKNGTQAEKERRQPGKNQATFRDWFIFFPNRL
jgi:hypothetical protein